MFRLGSFFLFVLAAVPAFAGEVSQESAVIAISAGSSAANGSFIADTDFSGGTPYSNNISINTSNVSNPAPQAVYQNCRYGSSFSYVIPGLTAGAQYLVRIHLAELYYTEPGSRVFNVSLNNVQVLNDFDLVAVTGGEGIANIQQFQAMADGNGRITIAFTGVVDNAEVNGIEILNASSLPLPTPTPSYNLSLSSNLASYTPGSSATVVATLSGAPTNPDEEFVVAGAYMSTPIAFTPITNSQIYAITPALSTGVTTVIATVYLQNSTDAAMLNDAVWAYQDEISRLNRELAAATDPNLVATLTAKIAHAQDRLYATQLELIKIRRPIGAPVTLNLTAF